MVMAKHLRIGLKPGDDGDEGQCKQVISQAQ